MPTFDVNCIAAPDCPAGASASGGGVSRSAEDRSRLVTVVVQCIERQTRCRGDIGAVVVWSYNHLGQYIAGSWGLSVRN